MDIIPYSFALNGVCTPLRRALRLLRWPDRGRIPREDLERARDEIRKALEAFPTLLDFRDPQAPSPPP